MRMPFLAELRWLLAAKFMYWSLSLVSKEASVEMLDAFAKLAAAFRNDTKFDTIPMRKK